MKGAHITAEQNLVLQNYYRAAGAGLDFGLTGKLSSETGYFRFGEGVTCFGQCAAGPPVRELTNGMFDAATATCRDGERVLLPFDAAAVADNLRQERYFAATYERQKSSISLAVMRNLYYFARPALSVGFRRHLQKFYHRGWQRAAFPQWPVDCTVDLLHERLLALALKNGAQRKIPFIWFWPEGARGCVVMTHDVETESGRDFCSNVMDIDELYGFKGSFQVVPEKRYAVPPDYLAGIRSRGHEVNVQDLNHDGRLFDNRALFQERARKINEYVRSFGARGFRAAVLYRRLDWFDAFDFSYDMSVPNVAHLDPQKGGCCTVMPYFVGKILEMPVTTTQDYQLFHILQDYSLTLWKQQIDLILERNGLISFIIHPDYVIQQKPQDLFKALLQHLAETCASRKVWKALPRDMDQWWRERNEMRLVASGASWRIEGAGAGRARVAFAELDGDRVVYSLQPHGS